MNVMTTTELFDRLGEPDRMRTLAAYDLFHPELQEHLDRVAGRSAQRLRAPVSMASILLDSAPAPYRGTALAALRIRTGESGDEAI